MSAFRTRLWRLHQHAPSHGVCLSTRSIASAFRTRHAASAPSTRLAVSAPSLRLVASVFSTPPAARALGRASTLDQYAIQTAVDMPQAWRMIRRFWQTALREDLRGQHFLTVLPDLESTFVSLGPAFAAAAAQPNANAESIMSAVLREHVAVAQGASIPSSSGSGSAGSGPQDPNTEAVGQAAYQRALFEPRFQQLVRNLAGLNTSTSAGRRDILLTGFASGTPLVAKVIHTGSAVLSRRHPALGLINDSRGELPQYFGFHLTVDHQTKTVPSQLKEFAWAGPTGSDMLLMDCFLARKYTLMDAFNGPNGINAIKACERNQRDSISFTDPLDFFSTSENVRSYSAYMHRLLCSIGGVRTVTPPLVGHTFETWGAFYIQHIEMAFKLSTLVEQIAWISDASHQFLLWLQEAEQTVTRFIFSSQPDVSKLDVLTTLDCAPAKHLLDKQRGKALLDDGRQVFDYLQFGPAANGGAPYTDHLPKLSEHKGLTMSTPAGGKVPVMTFAPDFKTPSGCRPKAKEKPSREGLDQGKGRVQPPGSNTHMWAWLSATELVSGRSVWDIAKIKADFSVPSDACWPVLLSTKFGDNVLSVCDQHTASDHRHVGKGAHKQIPGFDPASAAIRAAYCRAATAEEQKKLGPDPNAGGRGKGGGGRGGRGGRRGRGIAKPARGPFRQQA